MCATGSGIFLKGLGGGGLAGGAVRARVPAKPMKSVFKREPRGREEQKGGPAGAVRARVPAKPIESV